MYVSQTYFQEIITILTSTLFINNGLTIPEQDTVLYSKQAAKNPNIKIIIKIISILTINHRNAK